jgi:tetratricopeptide (TPR) repeat protein
MQTPPPPARSLVPEIPEPLDGLVSRCLLPDRAARYQTTEELEADFDRLDENGELIPIKRVVGLPVVGALVALALALLIGTWYFAPGPAPPVQHAAVSVLIADFENRANDPVFEGSLEQALGISIEGASFITSFRRQDAKRLAAQIKPGSRLDESVATLVSVREGIKVVLAGSIEPKGAGYTISLKAVDPAVNKTLATASAFAPTKAQVLRVVGSLAAKMRSVLGDTTSESEKLAAAETFTAGSLEAVRAYSLAQDLQAAGKDEPSIEYYKRAVDQDPKFGRAYAGWALSAFHLGRNDEANEEWKVALSLMDRMTEREKYRTQGTYYRNVSRDYEKARDTYETLVKLYPADYVGHNNLAIAYFNLRNFRKALEEGRRAVEIYPKSLVIRTNYSLYGMYAGDFTTAAAEARHAIDLDPASPYFKAFLPLAVAALATSNDAAALDAYDRMARTGPQGSSLANIGMADLAMYEGRFGDAEAVLQAGIADDQKTKNGAALATKYLALAESYEAQGKTRLALATARKALTLGSRDEAVVVPAARIFLRAGEDTGARGIAAELGQHLQSQSRAFGKLIEGEIAARQHRTVDAVEALRAASALTDLWLARFSLGVAYVQAEHYFEGLAELEACQKRQGEATAIFLDDVASFRYLAPLPYWLARAQQGVGQNDASVANYKKFLALKSPTTPDPLAADARRRVGTH